jgi:isopenicillin-N N-acyltransferase-like protein
VSLTILQLKLLGNDPREWGRQQGEHLRTQIRELNAIRQELLAGFLKGWSHGKIVDLCLDHARALEKKDADLWAEVQGLSEASGVKIADLMALNAYTDMRDFSAGDKARSEDGCSILAAKSSSANFCAQTWDMHGSATPYMLVLEVPGPVPAHVLTITGCLGLAGLNQHGVSVMINNMHCRETNRHGLVWPGLVRKILRSRTVAAARSTLETNIPSSGHNYLLFDINDAVNVETSGQRFEVTSSLTGGESGYIIHTNHYVGSLKETEILDRQSPTTHARYGALEHFTRTHDVNSVTGETLKRGLFEEGSTCDLINFPYSDKNPHAGATCGGLYVDHVARKACAFAGLYNGNKRLEWNF